MRGVPISFRIFVPPILFRGVRNSRIAFRTRAELHKNTVPDIRPDSDRIFIYGLCVDAFSEFTGINGAMLFSPFLNYSPRAQQRFLRTLRNVAPKLIQLLQELVQPLYFDFQRRPPQSVHRYVSFGALQ